MSLKQEPLTPKNLDMARESLDIDLKANLPGINNNNNNNNPCDVGVNNNNLPGSTVYKQCQGCCSPIADRFLLHAMDRYWHTTCLKCSCCQAPLGEIGQTCFSKAGMILCRNDYIRMFGSTGRCSACARAIPASELVMKAQGHVYHVDCFACVTCRNRLVPGDRFSIFNGSLLCELDFPKAVRAAHSHVPLRATHKTR